MLEQFDDAINKDANVICGGKQPEEKGNFEKISRELKTGMVACNNLAYSAPYNPFGGVKKSGLGRTRGKWGLRGLCNIKVVTFEK